MLFKRQEILLCVIDFLSKENKTSKLYLEKVLFLLKEEQGLSKINFYNFYPYRLGPFSRLSYIDKNYLVKKGLLEDNEIKLTEDGKKYLNEKNIDYNTELTSITSKFKNEDDLVKYIYNKYPNYKKKSILIEQNKNNQKTPCIFTIGYEKKDIDCFLYELIDKDIDLVIDVRKNPFSMNYTFIGKKLQSTLNSDNTNIQYIHLPELGIESKDRKELKDLNDYKKLFLDYEKTLISKEKQEKLNEIINLGTKYRIALLCFEKDPKYCHRGVIANHLRKKGIEVIDL